MACNWVRPAAFHTQTQRQKSDTMQAWVYFDALRVPAHCARVSTPYLVCQMPGESSPASPHRKRSWRGRLWDDFLRNSSGLNLATAKETQVGHALPLRSSCSTATLLLWTGSGPWLHIGCKCGPCASNCRSSWTSPPLRETRQTFQLSFDYRLHCWSIVRPKPKLRHSASSFWSKMLQRLQGTYAMNQKILSPSLWRDLIPPCQAKARSQKKHAKARKARRAAMRDCMSDALFLWFVQRSDWLLLVSLRFSQSQLMWSILLLFRRTKGSGSWTWSETARGNGRPTPQKKADLAIILGVLGVPLFSETPL